MEDFMCPRCRTSKFQNPSLKMMVNVCGHGLCENCVDLLFLKGSGACPECRIPLRRNNFRLQLFEDAAVEKEVDIRKRVLRDFNKKQEDFESLQEYNDYLEEVETIIFNLTNDIDVVNTNKKIEQYKRDNKEQILRNKNRPGREEMELEEILEWEKQQKEYRTRQILTEEQMTKTKKLREKEMLIDELTYSTGDAKNIVENFEKITKAQPALFPTEPPPPPASNASKITQFSTGIQFGRQGQTNQNSVFVPLNNIDDGPLFVYKPQKIVQEGPPLPAKDEIVQKGYTKHVRQESEQERAGGFKSTMACMRALQDALSGLYHVKKP